MNIFIRDEQGSRNARINKKIFVVGTSPAHDVTVAGPAMSVAFTLIQRANSSFDLIPGDFKLRLNGKPISSSVIAEAADRLEWNGGAAVLVTAGGEAATEAMQAGALRSLQALQSLAANLQIKGALDTALEQILEHLLQVSGAEACHLLSEMGERGEWQLMASRSARPEEQSPSRQELFSNTILKEAILRREPVCVESLIGHPWSQVASVIASKLFSVACLPLCVDDRIFGAVYLFTSTPGRSIRRETLPELNLLLSQAALMLATQSELRRARRENASLRRLVAEWPSNLVLGNSLEMQDLARRVSKIASAPLSVLIQGETGTGKEVLAREIHRQSPRAKGSFVAINCAAIPETLLESTLFGHERGAFTGAVRAQAGKFMQADGGTLLLDEIADLPLDLQAKLLRVLQEKIVEPVGATKGRSIDVRVLAATHQDLETAVKNGKFRQDLYYRLNGAILRIPALRDRRADILPLARYFLQKIDSPLTFSREAEVLLEGHTWPGNVRELEQTVSRAAMLCEGDVIQSADLELGSLTPANFDDKFFWQNLKDAQKTFTNDYVQKVLAKNQGNRAATAAQLGVSERSLYRILAGDSSGSEA
ncbi:MAG: sigma-54-dependent Fis family transcriptional regulator [Bdellovibrionales bacterium]|nr:sigma-54-dependent Fis family transcriptional regulator [Bdellovibrionales bacterium]